MRDRMSILDLSKPSMLTYPLLFTTDKGNIAQVFNPQPDHFSFEVTSQKDISTSFTYTKKQGAMPAERKNGKLNTDELDVLNTWLSLVG